MSCIGHAWKQNDNGFIINEAFCCSDDVVWIGEETKGWNTQESNEAYRYRMHNAIYCRQQEYKVVKV